MIEEILFDQMLASYREEVAKLPPPPPGYYYVARIGDIRQEGDRFVCDAVLTLEPIVKEGQG